MLGDEDDCRADMARYHVTDTYRADKKRLESGRVLFKCDSLGTHNLGSR